MRRAKKSVEELARIKHDKIYINIDPLIEKFRLKVNLRLFSLSLSEGRRNQGILSVEISKVRHEDQK